MRAREGDLIQTRNNVIFDVKGLVHPPEKIVAFPRYLPSKQGTRVKGKNLYSKVYNLSERLKYLQKNAPQLIVADPVFGETICEVPIAEIAKHYKPIEKLKQLRKRKHLAELERKAVTLAENLKDAALIQLGNIGISGSIMAGLFTLQSDIDPLVYGTQNCRKVYSTLKRLQRDENSQFKPYTKDELWMLFDFRSKDTKMSFEDFAKVEQRKAFQGKFEGADYFVRFVKKWDEVNERYGDVSYRNSGYAKIVAIVADDSDALFTPCTYILEKVIVVEGPRLEPITEVVSFRGRFCQQACEGEEIIVQGKVEKVTNNRNGNVHYRIIIGGNPSDFMVLSKRSSPRF